MGVEVVVLQSGDGKRPRVGDTVKTHYVGTIVSNGSTFGSSQVRSVWNSHIISHELPTSPLTDISHGLLVLALVAYTIRGTPFVTEIGVGKAIKGWDEGVLQLTEGSRAILKVSPDYAYGTRGFPPVIPPNAALEFEVELLEIKRSENSS